MLRDADQQHRRGRSNSQPSDPIGKLLVRHAQVAAFRLLRQARDGAGLRIRPADYESPGGVARARSGDQNGLSTTVHSATLRCQRSSF